jgi:hypothetical protein
MKYGYARVSTDGQSVDAQVRQLTKAGCKKGVPRSGERRKDRPGAASPAARPARRRRRADGDAARPAGAIHSRPVEHSRRDHRQECRFQIPGDTWADTTTSLGRLMLTVLGGLAEFERELIRARTGEGRARAGARGQKMGRLPKLISGAKRSSAATVVTSPLRTSGAATTSARRRFRGSRYDTEDCIAMLSFTLDTNCVIDLDENRPAAPAIKRLAVAHATGSADVAVVAIMASEKQRAGDYIEDFQVFQHRLEKLSISHLGLLLPIFYWDITFWDWSLWSDANMQALERHIHKVLFPRVEFLWPDYCRTQKPKLDPATSPAASPAGHTWRNAKCDVLAIWSHVHHRRDVFVTTDRNFHKRTKKPALLSLGARRIERPQIAAALF